MKYFNILILMIAVHYNVYCQTYFNIDSTDVIVRLNNIQQKISVRKFMDSVATDSLLFSKYKMLFQPDGAWRSFELSEDMLVKLELNKGRIVYPGMTVSEYIRAVGKPYAKLFYQPKRFYVDVKFQYGNTLYLEDESFLILHTDEKEQTITRIVFFEMLNGDDW